MSSFAVIRLFDHQLPAFKPDNTSTIYKWDQEFALLEDLCFEQNGVGWGSGMDRMRSAVDEETSKGEFPRCAAVEGTRGIAREKHSNFK